MRVHTDRYGNTAIRLRKDEVAHAPSLHTRVTNACIPYGIIERGTTARIRDRAIALIEKYPRHLTAEQAVRIVLAGKDT